MNEITLKNIDILKISKNGYIYSGASQQWYKQKWQRQSGCGPTTATNQLLYLANTNEKANSLFYNKDINYPNVLTMMEDVWEYITPTIMGVNKVEILIDGAKKYAKSMNVNLDIDSLKIPIVKSNRPSLKNLKNFIITSLKSEYPVAFLNLSAGSLANLSSWHWVLVVGVEYDYNKLIVSIFDEGIYKKIDLKLWLETSFNGGGFVTLKL